MGGSVGGWELITATSNDTVIMSSLQILMFIILIILTTTFSSLLRESMGRPILFVIDAYLWAKISPFIMRGERVAEKGRETKRNKAQRGR